MAGKRLQKRRKKQGIALLISRLLRLGLLVGLLACAWLVVLGVNACASHFEAASAASHSAEQESGAAADMSAAAEETSRFTGLMASGVVTIDPGHGGNDPGCGEDTPEKDIVLPICLKLRDQLEEAGVVVVMTRQSDETLSLDKRAEMANAAGSDLFVSVHCNSFEGAARGMDCYYYKSESAKRLAQAILDQAAALGITTREVQKNNYQVLWDTDMAAVLVETGFLTDPEERTLLCDAEYQERVAQAIAAAVLEVLGTGLA